LKDLRSSTGERERAESADLDPKQMKNPLRKKYNQNNRTWKLMVASKL
jgi:hypothetical protein